jgi:hypothetical protein
MSVVTLVRTLFSRPGRRAIVALFAAALMLLPAFGTIFPASPPPAVAQGESASGQDGPAAQPDAPQYNSLSLSGIDGYVRVPYSTELNFLSAITIEAWVWRVNTAANETVVGNSWEESYWFGFSSSGTLRFIPFGSSSIVDSNSTVPAGKWTHVAITYNGSTRNYYIDGVLDKTTTESPGPITGNSNEPLGIGFDVNDTFGPNYFHGRLDEVRIWNTVRSPAQIQAGMFQVFSPPLPSSLIGYWRLDGNASDETGDHDGTLQGSFGSSQWINSGGIPHDIRIPQLAVTPSLDGQCSLAEYDTAIGVSVGAVQVYLMHTADDLWVCYDFYLDPDYQRAMLFLDPNHDRLDPAQPGDIRFEVHDDDSLVTQVGTGTGTYTPTNAYDGLWDGEYTVTGGEFPNYSAEMRLDESILGAWGNVVGLALGTDTGLILGAELWPALADSSLPSTWSHATLGSTGPSRTFSGKVQYQPKNHGYSPSGVMGATVELYGYDPGGSEALVATDTSAPSGAFSLTTDDDYSRHRLELAGLPQGYVPDEAEAPAPGLVLDARAIDYGTAGGGTYADNVFTLGDANPQNLAAPYGPVFLIVAPDYIIDSGALDEFRDFKIGQGYAVSIRSVEEADTYPGPTRLERIRAMEQDYLQMYGDRFQFVMLVGPDTVIPYARLTPWATGAPGTTCPTTDPVNFKYSEWMYVDLESNFDSNGNGCYADGLRTKQSELVSGYTPDSGIQFKANVAVGRVPFTSPTTIRNMLRNSIGFEKQSEAFKKRTLMGSSMLALKGYWAGEECAGHWGDHCVSPSPNTQANYDLALLPEEMKADFLDQHSFQTTVFYENEAEVAGGQGIHSPVVVSQQAIVDELNDKFYGLVNIAGHGSSGGIGRDYWKADLNFNGVVDVSDDSNTNERGGGPQLNTTGAGQLTPDYSRGAIFMLVSCNTIAPSNQSNIGATLLANGHGIATVGGLNIITVGNWFDENSGRATTDNYYTVQRLLDEAYRLGEAFWWTLSSRIAAGDPGSGTIGEGLYGDPTLSFFGNPGGQATRAAWPMGRRDPAGSGYLTLPGPSVPKPLWDYESTPMPLNTWPAAPAVSNNGEVIVASGPYVDVLRQGALYQRLTLDADVFGSVALSADGTIYAVDVNGKLYAFPYQRFYLGNIVIYGSQRYRRWTYDLLYEPQTSPVIGAGGFIAVAVEWPDSHLTLVRPDGHPLASLNLSGHAVHYAATTADRSFYVTTQESGQGRLYRWNPFCDQSFSPGVCAQGSIGVLAQSAIFTTPPLVAYGHVYAGDAASRLLKVDPDTMQAVATFTADSPPRFGPIAAPGGSVVFISDQGTLYSLTKDLALRWQTSLGTVYADTLPAASADAIYVALDYELQAYNPHSGALRWTRGLPGSYGLGGASVGYGREVYVQTVSGDVFAFGEGWGYVISSMTAIPLTDSTRSIVRIEMLQSLTPGDAESPIEPEAPQADVVSVLLQRSADGGPWEDVALLPPGTEVFTDTNVMADMTYAYRAQNLMSDGQNSDFQTGDGAIQTLPALPTAPTLDAVDAQAADALHLSWTPAAGDVVGAFRIEGADAPGGPFTPVMTVTGETVDLLDTGLDPNTTRHYRLVASNQSGESPPSNVLGATTHAQTLAAPQNVQATLLEDGWIQLTWDAGPASVSTEIELLTFGLEDYVPLDTAGASGPYLYLPAGPNAYDFRLKFVQGDDESPYTETGTSVVVQPNLRFFLPIVVRN